MSRRLSTGRFSKRATKLFNEGASRGQVGEAGDLEVAAEDGVAHMMVHPVGARHPPRRRGGLDRRVGHLDGSPF